MTRKPSTNPRDRGKQAASRTPATRGASGHLKTLLIVLAAILLLVFLFSLWNGDAGAATDGEPMSAALGASSLPLPDGTPSH